jgi:hypothetical protein
MAKWEERHTEQEAELYHCECASLDCMEKISVSSADYERVRQEADKFLIVNGHEIIDVETVVEKNENWSVVRKDPEVKDLVRETDPRS